MECRKTALPLILLLATLLTICMAKLLVNQTPLFNVSAVETAGDIGIYWDTNCTRSVNSIDWGNLSLVEVKKVVVYVRNNGNESTSIILITANWIPENAYQYLLFSWNCEHKKIEVHEVLEVTLSLYVSPRTSGISNFDFDIIFKSGEFILGDTNGDGVVDMMDVVIVCDAFGYTLDQFKYNPCADLNSDGKVDMWDIVTVCGNFGKHI